MINIRLISGDMVASHFFSKAVLTDTMSFSIKPFHLAYDSNLDNFTVGESISRALLASKIYIYL